MLSPASELVCHSTVPGYIPICLEKANAPSVFVAVARSFDPLTVSYSELGSEGYGKHIHDQPCKKDRVSNW